MLSGHHTNSVATAFRSKFYSGNEHCENERQSYGSITAPVHTKFNMNSNNSNSHITTNRFINNNNTQSHTNHFSLSLNRHNAEYHNAKLGVGCNGTLTSPYSYVGNGVVEKLRGTKSDIDYTMLSKRTHGNGCRNGAVHKPILPSVKSDFSIHDSTTLKSSCSNVFDTHGDTTNNNIHNTLMESPANSSAIMTLSKTGSKLLYSNKHRLESFNQNHKSVQMQNRTHADSNSNNCGPLLYKNDNERNHNNWNDTFHDNSMRMVSW